jgi:hypothetical protein
VSEVETVRTAMYNALGTALGTGTLIIKANSTEDFTIKLRNLGTVGVAYGGREWEPKPTAIGKKKQNSNPTYFVLYAAPGPGPGVTTGKDVFSLMEAGAAALIGLEVTVGAQKIILLGASEALVLENGAVGGLLYEQRWRYWKAG